MRFEFATASRIVFGEGCSKNLGREAEKMGSHALVVTGAHPERWPGVLESLEEWGVAQTRVALDHEPTTADVLDATDAGRERGCDLVVALGGGSVIDAGKAVAAMLTNPGEVMDYLEVVGAGKPLAHDPAPTIALPTTAGTGAEVTRNAVLLSPDDRVKVSMRNPAMIPDIALVDPALTWSMPPEVTVFSGLDALTQLIEVFLSCQANPLTDGVCREGIPRAAGALERAWRDGTDAEARRDMALASLFGGLALANAKLGAVHGFAGPIGGMCSAPHGAACAALLPCVLRTNALAMREREADNPALNRMDELGRMLTGQGDADAAVEWVERLCATLEVPRLGTYGLRRADAAELATKARKASSMKGNPIELTHEELLGILNDTI